MYKEELPKFNFGLYGPFKIIESLQEDEPLLKIKPKFDELVKRNVIPTKMGIRN